MEEKKTNKKFYILSIIIAIFVVAITVGVSYAYFTASIAGNNNATTSVITSGNMALELEDGEVIGTTQSMIPGDTITKQFSVRNTGTLSTTYDIYLSEVLNTFVDKSDLVYSISSSDGGYNTVSDQIVPSTSGNESKIINAQSINAGETHTYTLIIKFLNKNENQDDNKGATFSGKLQINEYKESVGKIAKMVDGLTFNNSLDGLVSSYEGRSVIEHITWANNIDNIDTEKLIVISTDDSESTIYAYYNYENKTLYLYSDQEKVFLNENSSGLFNTLTGLKDINMSKFDTSNVVNMAGMFANDISLRSIDLSNFDTSNVTNMTSMFSSCAALTSLNLSAFNTSNLENIQAMFAGVGQASENGLDSLDLSNFNTSKITSFNAFSGLKVQNLNLSNWIFNVGNKISLFSGLASTKNINLSNSVFNTTDLQSMFSSTNVETINLSHASFMDNSDATGMFAASKVKTIYVSEDFDNTKFTNSTQMFYECTNLVGGNNTIFNSSHIDSEYARIDTPTTPGYFTLYNN